MLCWYGILQQQTTEPTHNVCTCVILLARMLTVLRCSTLTSSGTGYSTNRRAGSRIVCPDAAPGNTSYTSTRLFLDPSRMATARWLGERELTSAARHVAPFTQRKCTTQKERGSESYAELNRLRMSPVNDEVHSGLLSVNSLPLKTCGTLHTKKMHNTKRTL